MESSSAMRWGFGESETNARTKTNATSPLSFLLEEELSIHVVLLDGTPGCVVQHLAYDGLLPSVSLAHTVQHRHTILRRNCRVFRGGRVQQQTDLPSRSRSRGPWLLDSQGTRVPRGSYGRGSTRWSSPAFQQQGHSRRRGRCKRQVPSTGGGKTGSKQVRWLQAMRR